MNKNPNNDWDKLVSASQNLFLYFSFILAGCVGYARSTNTAVTSTLRSALNLFGGSFLTAKYTAKPIDALE